MIDRELLKSVGKQIQKARLANGITQECLAELVGIHWKTMGRIERGVLNFGVSHLARIAQHLDVSPNRLLEGIESPDVKRSAAIRKAMVRKRAPIKRQRKATN